MNILDIAISTEQNWANVQSILGRPGHAERVVWLETPSAAAGRWATCSNALLLASGCEDSLTLSMGPDEEVDPAALQTWVTAHAETFADRELHLHLNGGTKLHQAVLSDVLGNRATLHYTQNGVHHHRPQGGTWSSGPSAMTPSFTELLYCYGFEIQPGRIQFLDLNAFRDSFLARQKGFTPTATEEQLQARWYAFQKTASWAQRTSGAGGEASRLAAWLQSASAQAAFLAYRRGLRPDRPDVLLTRDWQNFEREMGWALGQVAAEGDPEAEAFTPRGVAFEAEVGQVLAQAAAHFPVVQAGSNLHIHPIGQVLRRAEVDHAWMLPGGRVWVFECKVGVAARKDMEARLRALRECFGSSVRVFLVVPQQGAHQDMGEVLRLPIIAMDHAEGVTGQLRCLAPKDYRA